MNNLFGPVNVIVQYNSTPGLVQQLELVALGGTITHQYSAIPAVSVTLPGAGILGLLRDPLVSFISLDRQVAGTLDLTTAASGPIMRSKPDTPARGLASRSSIAASTIIPTWLAASSTGKVSSRPRILTTTATAHTWPASRLETARRPAAFTAASPWRASYRSAHFGRQWNVQRQRRDRRHRSRHRPQEPIQDPRDQSLDRAAHFRKLHFGPAVPAVTAAWKKASW